MRWSEDRPESSEKLKNLVGIGQLVKKDDKYLQMSVKTNNSTLQKQAFMRNKYI